MKIVIVEDELLIAEMLKEMLIDLEHEVVGIAKNFDQAIVLLESFSKIDLCFLDINLKEEKSGFDVAKIVNNQYNIPYVFLTSYSDKKTIANAIQYQPEAYLLKPFSEIDLFTTIEIINGKKQLLHATKSVVFKDGVNTVKLPIDEILYLKSENIYVEVKTTSKTYLIRNSLSKFLEEIAVESIARIHRTFAVNILHVNAVSGEYVFIGNEKIPISRMHRDDFLLKFKS